MTSHFLPAMACIIEQQQWRGPVAWQEPGRKPTITSSGSFNMARMQTILIACAASSCICQPCFWTPICWSRLCCAVEVSHAWRPNLPDEADNHLFGLGVAAQADAIITRSLCGISHGELKFPSLRVLTPEHCLEVIPCLP